MNYRTQILNSGFIQGGPRLSKALRESKAEFDRIAHPTMKPCLQKQRIPLANRLHRALRWLQVD